MAGLRRCTHHLRTRRPRIGDGQFRLPDPDRSAGAVRSAADRAGRPLGGRARAGAERDTAIGESPGGPGLGPGLVVIDKPAGMTSHDVVARCRRIFSTRRAGHAGALEPMASGVLDVGVDRATKILGLLTAASKSYAATIRLGQTTSTEDAEGELLQTFSAEHVTDEAIAAAVAGLRGEIEQAASAVSAIKIDGRRAYRLVREGREVELEARPVRIDRFEVCDVRFHDQLVDVDVEVDCSSGTYIRALARDLGAALGVGGHLTSLRRTRGGPFGLGQSHSLDDLAGQPRLSLTLDEACLLMFPRRELSAGEAEAAGN